MIRSAARFLPAFASVMMASGGAHAASTPSPAAPGWEECGEASWYGGRHNGRRTSSGQIFNMNAMTAAHATLPLGSRVRVTMQDTGTSVIVTITDRQPPKFARVIDLSRGAASRLGLLSRGTAMVTLSGIKANEANEEVAELPDADDATPAPAPRTPRRAAPRKPAAGRTSALERPTRVAHHLTPHNLTPRRYAASSPVREPGRGRGLV